MTEEDPGPEKKSKPRSVGNVLQYLAIGSEVFALVVGPIGLGYLYDIEFGTSPGGLIVGFVLMIILVVQFLRNLVKRLGS